MGFELGLDIPTLTTSSLGYWLTVFSAIILFVIIGATLFWIYYNNKIFNKRIEIYENISGNGWQKTGTDRARIIKVGDGGEEIMFLKRRKTYRTAYGKKMGPNMYWFAVGQDGYWYNVVLGDLDAKMGMLDIEPIDRDMRYMHVAIRKNIQERYRKISFMEKYGTIMMNGIFLLIMVGALWFLITQIGDLITTAQQTVEATKPIAEAMQTIVGNLDNLCSNTGISAV